MRKGLTLTKGWAVVRGLALAALGLCGGLPALAVDGVIEINQARALAGGVTPGDAPGFPVSISESGSYRLTGNLTVPDVNTGGIEVLAGWVLIDLNNFSIQGPNTCSGCPATGCTGGTGKGIYTTGPTDPIAVRNGVVRGMGSTGIELNAPAQIENVLAVLNGGRGIWVTGIGGLVAKTSAVFNGFHGLVMDNATVSQCKAGCNGGDGIQAGFHSVVVDNTTSGNNLTGIFSNAGSTVRGNTAYANVGIGISVAGGSTVTANTAYQNGAEGLYVNGGSSVNGNTATDNTGVGLHCAGSVGYVGNVYEDNNGGNLNPQLSGSCISTGGNVCRSTTTCP